MKMAATAGTLPPPISWAQRKELLYVIVDVECKDINHKVTENSFVFTGTNALDSNIKYNVTLNFLNPVNPETVTQNNTGRCIEYTVYKKESGPFWKSLTNDKTKLHFLKANFTKWINESDDEEEDFDASDFMMNNKLQGADMLKSFDDFNVDEDDDSDDNIPSLYQNDDDEDDKKEEKKDEEK